MKPHHYFSETQTGKEVIKKVKVSILSHDFEFYTASGVFSADKIDAGTIILIENIKINNGNSKKPDNYTVLDFGCGIGVVGIVIKKLHPETDVYLTDINTRAVKISHKNAELNNSEIKAFHGNLFEAIPKELKFETIISNLPQHAGRKVCFDIIQQSKDFLNKNGTLQVVARHQKGGKEIEKKMNEVFGNVETLVKESGYRVYASRKV